MRRAPVFASTVILTIALGIGVNTAAFTIFTAYLLRPIPVDDPYSLYVFTWTDRTVRVIGSPGRIRKSWQTDQGILVRIRSTNVVTRINGRLAFGEPVTRNYFRWLESARHAGGHSPKATGHPNPAHRRWSF